MHLKTLILKDVYHGTSNTSLELVLKKILEDYGEKIYYIDTILKFEEQQLTNEFAIFSHDINQLKKFDYPPPVSEIYFFEPDLSFTLIEYESQELCLYVNMDSGLRLNNCATNSGISLRLNVTKSDFEKFINDLLSVENIDV
ncbi:hypothetical protein DWB90_04540 [Staphylococcus chromogenes]|uniref:hypothetical protein n=1 Tax=Staphylococcus chromogenes TaxID=46126 RepID=UPI000D02F872|nr:hypothetical protein [Staphylococcus chromogenes]MBV5192187.1 hypothetical protein [Staphylococcus chromogenes]MBW3132458.1 hypothetical protein [Staphylococcus chromogenes]PTF38576.1 hypothetical protein BUY17_00015 [Staphylococcus chromogenes]PTF46925.1 hypothetical protein BUY13_10970 [Staphylococcus chromogenes]PTF50369.1 hypothetical protein BUY12_10750 [Staphylococcus chromogenes]